MPPFKSSPDNLILEENPDLLAMTNATELVFADDSEIDPTLVEKNEKVLPGVDSIGQTTKETDIKSPEIAAEKNVDIPPTSAETKKVIEPPAEMVAEFGEGTYENSFARQMSGRIDLATGIEYGMDGKPIDLSTATAAETSEYQTFKQKLIDNLGSTVTSAKEVKTKNGTELHVNLFTIELDGTVYCEGWKRIIDDKKVEPSLETEKKIDIGGAFDEEVVGDPSVTVNFTPELGEVTIGGFNEVVASKVEPIKATESQTETPVSIFVAAKDRVRNETATNVLENSHTQTENHRAAELLHRPDYAEAPQNREKPTEKPIKKGEIVTFDEKVSVESTEAGTTELARENNIEKATVEKKIAAQVETPAIIEKIDVKPAAEIPIVAEIISTPKLTEKITQPISELSPEVTGITLEIVTEDTANSEHKSEATDNVVLNLQNEKTGLVQIEKDISVKDIEPIEKKSPLELYGIAIDTVEEAPVHTSEFAPEVATTQNYDVTPNQTSEPHSTFSNPTQADKKHESFIPLQKIEQPQTTITEKKDDTLPEEIKPKTITIEKISDTILNLDTKQKSTAEKISVEKNAIDGGIIDEPVVELSNTHVEPVTVEQNVLTTETQTETEKPKVEDVIFTEIAADEQNKNIKIETSKVSEDTTELPRRSQSLSPRNDEMKKEVPKIEKTQEIQAKIAVEKSQPIVEKKILNAPKQKVEKISRRIINNRGIQPRTERPMRRNENKNALNTTKEITSTPSAPNFIQRTRSTSPIVRLLTAVRPTEMLRNLTRRRPAPIIDQQIDDSPKANQLRIIRYANNS